MAKTEAVTAKDRGPSLSVDLGFSASDKNVGIDVSQEWFAH
jgi:hypothetical protein